MFVWMGIERESQRAICLLVDVVLASHRKLQHGRQSVSPKCRVVFGVCSRLTPHSFDGVLMAGGLDMWLGKSSYKEVARVLGNRTK